MTNGAEYLRVACRKTNKLCEMCFPFSRRRVVISIQVHSIRKGMPYDEHDDDDGSTRRSEITALHRSNVRRRVMISQYLDKMRLNRKYLLRLNEKDIWDIVILKIYFQ